MAVLKSNWTEREPYATSHPKTWDRQAFQSDSLAVRQVLHSAASTFVFFWFCFFFGHVENLSSFQGTRVLERGKRKACHLGLANPKQKPRKAALFKQNEKSIDYDPLLTTEHSTEAWQRPPFEERHTNKSRVSSFIFSGIFRCWLHILRAHIEKQNWLQRAEHVVLEACGEQVRVGRKLKSTSEQH